MDKPVLSYGNDFLFFFFKLVSLNESMNNRKQVPSQRPGFPVAAAGRRRDRWLISSVTFCWPEDPLFSCSAVAPSSLNTIHVQIEISPKMSEHPLRSTSQGAFRTQVTGASCKLQWPPALPNLSAFLLHPAIADWEVEKSSKQMPTSSLRTHTK